MKIGIIGGGITGLVAAHALAPDHEITLFETMPYPGGCLSSYHINDYWIERSITIVSHPIRHFSPSSGNSG
jgi:protoporphyrinogen oxidase